MCMYFNLKLHLEMGTAFHFSLPWALSILIWPCCKVTRIVSSSPTAVGTNPDHIPFRDEREVTRAGKVRENGVSLATDRSPSEVGGMATF